MLNERDVFEGLKFEWKIEIVKVDLIKKIKYTGGGWMKPSVLHHLNILGLWFDAGWIAECWVRPDDGLDALSRV